MQTTAFRDSGLGWLVTALLALQIALTLSVSAARAEMPSAGEALALRPSLEITGDRTQGNGRPAELRLAAITPPDAEYERAAPSGRTATRPTGPDVFGSVAVPTSPLAITPRWKEILAEDAGRYFTDDCPNAGPHCQSENWSEWQGVHDRAAEKSGAEQFAYVNARVNDIVRYATDRELYGQSDHWATLEETLAHGAGDCEDIAIAKMWMLEALGVPLENMQIVALKDRRRNIGHAVLAVEKADGRTLILDNVHDAVLEDRQVRHYQPIFSVSAEGSWVHGFRRGSDQLSAAENSLRGSRP